MPFLNHIFTPPEQKKMLTLGWEKGIKIFYFGLLQLQYDLQIL